MGKLSLERLEDLEELERRLDRLRVLYEQYFQGIEKVEPTVLRKDVARAVLEANLANIRNTAHKFKARSFIQRFNVYQNYWNRVVRSMEDGTSRRGRRERRLPEPSGTVAPSPASASASAPASASTSSVPTPPGGAGSPAPGTVSPGSQPGSQDLAGFGEERMADLFRRVVLARQSLDQPLSDLSYESFARSVRAQVPALRERLKAADVDFEVVLRDGKVRLKPVPRR